MTFKFCTYLQQRTTVSNVHPFWILEEASVRKRDEFWTCTLLWKKRKTTLNRAKVPCNLHEHFQITRLICTQLYTWAWECFLLFFVFLLYFYKIRLEYIFPGDNDIFIVMIVTLCALAFVINYKYYEWLNEYASKSTNSNTHQPNERTDGRTVKPTNVQMNEHIHVNENCGNLGTSEVKKCTVLQIRQLICLSSCP